MATIAANNAIIAIKTWMPLAVDNKKSVLSLLDELAGGLDTCFIPLFVDVDTKFAVVRTDSYNFQI